MSFCLIADTEPFKGLPPFLYDNWRILLPPTLGFVAVYLLLPRPRRLLPMWGGVTAAAALILGASGLIRAESLSAEMVLFYAFSGVAIVGGGMMITQTNPVHAALSFAIVVLSTCGLFLLQAAPFLMAATIIVYAGAIVVTFLFVIMLAQQEGVSNADQRSREPFLATLAGCVLMAALVSVLHKTYDVRELDSIMMQLQQLSEVNSEAEVKSILGNPPIKGELKLVPTPKLIDQLKHHLGDQDETIDTEIGHIHTTWTHMQVNDLKKYAKSLHEVIKRKRDAHASLKLHDVPGKSRTPGHFPAGKLPAANVAALGSTLFTDYLIAVEMAAMLLLIATMGAIIIAGRRSEELR